MNVPTNRKYSETHEWYLLDGDVLTMGITQFAADELTDITFVELPQVGTSFAAGDAIGEVESVKATSELFTATGGTVTEINEALDDHPELLNDDAFEQGWLLKLEPTSTDALESLMSAEEYRAFIQGQ